MPQGQVVAVDVDGDARGREGAADHRQGAGARADQDGHVVPGDAVLQVGAAQDVGDVVQLGAGRRVGVHLDPATVAHGRRLTVQADLLGGQPGQRHAAGDPPGGLEERCAGAPGGAQHPDRGGAAVGAWEGVRELQDAADVGATERVDRLVGVAEGDEGAAAGRQGVQQPYLGGVGVLVLVDVDGVVAVGELPGRLGPPGEEHRAVDEFGVVDDALEVEDVEVFGEEGGGGAPVGAADAAGEGVQGAGVEPELAAAGEHGADLVGEAAGGQAGAQVVGPAHVGQPEPFQVHLAGEQLAHGDVLLGSESSRSGSVNRSLSWWARTRA